MEKENKLYGLTEAQVEQSRAQHGANKIIEAEPPSFLSRMFDAVKDPLLFILIGIATFNLVLTFLGYAEWFESVGTYLTVLLVAYVSAKTESSADAEYRKLKEKTKAEPVKVIRSGVLKVVDAEEIVVGDIVVLQSGDKIPADGVLIEGAFTVDNSSLNGETEECKKNRIDCDFPTHVSGETVVDDHTLFKGTTIFTGSGHGKVCRVGMDTMMGGMAADMAEEEVDSPLKVKLAKLAGQISKFGITGAVIIGIVYLIHYIMVAGGVSAFFAQDAVTIIKECLNAFSVAILIVVCAVPEGLPLMIALVLQANSSAMYKKNVLVRKAIGIETAGSLNVLFSDKTGTITKGKPDVVQVFTGDATVLDNTNHGTDITRMMNICIGKATQASFDDQHRVTGGNPTDYALLRYLTEEEYWKLNQTVVAHQDFNSKNKFSQAQIAEESNRVFYKGAPEMLLAKAKRYMAADGSIRDLDPTVINNKINELAERTMRVIAFGYSDKPLIEDTINDDLVIISLVGIRDDVRPEAKQAIEEVKQAGIQVVMITGDKLETAVAIGKEAGLLTGAVGVISAEDTKLPTEDFLRKAEGYETIAIGSKEINALSDDVIKKILPRIHVIARALPQDKSRMVRLTQELNLVCGMTGDGVNDSPALKRADVGFAMGSGTDAAKAAGDLIIVDDNFMSIRNAILYGRTIYHNILKFCKFQLSINVGAVLVSAVMPFLGVEEPLTVTQLLFVNLCMDTLGALLLGKEPAMQSYMHEAPRKRDESIVSKKMFLQFCIMGIYLLVAGLMWFNVPAIHDIFETDLQWKTGFFAMFMFASILNGFNVRNEGFNIFKDIEQNPTFFKVMGAMLGATFILCQISMLSSVVGNMFSTQAIGVLGWAVVLIVSLLVVPVDMLRKLVCGTYKEV